VTPGLHGFAGPIHFTVRLVAAYIRGPDPLVVLVVVCTQGSALQATPAESIVKGAVGRYSLLHDPKNRDVIGSRTKLLEWKLGA
jgi:hypothetical protein